jgi:hypothetical protein
MADTNPSKPSADYTAQSGYWDMVDHIMGGAEAIRANGETYLPKFESESKAEYDARLVASPWTPLYADSFRHLASKPFSKEVATVDGADDFKPLVENIDGSGNHLHVFSREVFKAGVNNGIDWIWVGHTPVPEGTTNAQKKTLKARSYWKRIPARRVLAVYSDTVNGSEVLTHMRIEENHTERDGFGERAVKQVRVLNREKLDIGEYGPATYEVFQAVRNDIGADHWVSKSAGNISIGVIPMVPFITGERAEGSWRVRPPLKDLAYMQITLFQMEANRAVVQANTAFPITVMQGVEKPAGSAGITLGPRSVLWFPPISDSGQYGDCHREEPAGSSAQSLREDVAEHKREMREAGMQPLVPTSGNLTATATAVSEAKAHSAVEAWAHGLKDALEQAFVITGLWLGEGIETPSVRVHTDFGLTGKDVEELRVLMEMNNPDHKLISDEAVILEARRRGLLGPEYDMAADRKLIETEMPGDSIADPLIA